MWVWCSDGLHNGDIDYWIWRYGELSKKHKGRYVNEARVGWGMEGDIPKPHHFVIEGWMGPVDYDHLPKPRLMEL